MGRYEFIVTIVTLSCTITVMTGGGFKKMILSSNGKMSTLMNIRLKYNLVFSKQVLLPTRYTSWDAPQKTIVNIPSGK